MEKLKLAPTNVRTSHLSPEMPAEASLSTSSTSTTLNQNPIKSMSPPFYLRLAYFLSLWSFKAFYRLSLSSGRAFSKQKKDLLQAEVKTYEIRPDLENRIFRPQTFGDEKLPLYLDVHGGGWAVADPQTDDEFCSFLAQNFNIVVVSVNYHKSPRYKFPHAVEDVAAIAIAVMDDEYLNIDRKRVVLGGFSAGANLAFAAAQMNSLRGQLSGLVGFYPALDLTESVTTKLKRRPHNSPSDVLALSANFLDWGYVPQGTDRRNPRLSPRWAEPRHLPSYVYLVGAEYDMLYYEAQQMAKLLARFSHSSCKRTTIPTLADGEGWQQGGIRWECAKGRGHAFTHITKHGEKEQERQRFCQELYIRVGTWLQKDVWAKQAII